MFHIIQRLIVKRLPWVMCLFLMAGTSSFAEIKIMTATGEVELTESPQRVAVFDLGVLHNLHLLDVEVGAVTDNLYISELTEHYGDLPVIGTLFEPDIEALLQFNPDLIIVATLSAEHAQKLSEIAPTIDMSIVGDDSFIALSKQRFAALGQIFDKEEEATAIISRLDNKFDQVVELAKDKGRSLMIMTAAQKISAFGQDSRFGWLYSEFGLSEAADNLQEAVHGEPISFEFIKANNPDWLLVLDRSAAMGDEGEAAQVVLDNPLVAETAAWKKNQVIYVDPAIYLAVGSLVAIESTIDAMQGAFAAK